MTALAEAFSRAGGPTPAEAAFRLAIAKYQNNGGSYERAVALLDAAYGKGGEGQRDLAPKDHNDGAFSSRTVDCGPGPRLGAEKATLDIPGPQSPLSRVEGQLRCADKARLRLPSGAANGDREGQIQDATQAAFRVPSRLRPVSPLYVAAARSGAKHVARSVLDSFRLRNGRAIGDMSFGELEAVRFDNAREASVIRQVQRLAGNATANQLVRDVIRADDLAQIIQRAAEVADAC